MSQPNRDDHALLLILASQALGISQKEVGSLLGVSRRTITRWTRGTQLLPSHAHILARAVFTRDPALAARLATAGDTTVDGLGLIQAAPDPLDGAKVRTLIDAVVCAAAEALDASPRAVRPALLAAFARASELGLTLERSVEGLRRHGPTTPRAEKTRPPPQRRSPR